MAGVGDIDERQANGSLNVAANGVRACYVLLQQVLQADLAGMYTQGIEGRRRAGGGTYLRKNSYRRECSIADRN
jgi:hypothetical protein